MQTTNEDNIIPVADIPLDEHQLTVVDRCASKDKIIAVTGKAGTGKTTIIKKAFEQIKALGYKPVLCAPTGKAAKRIREATGIEAQTIHRLLKYPMPDVIEEMKANGQKASFSRSGQPFHGLANPLEFDVIFCDEYAMVHQELHRNLFNAVPKGGMVRLFGDLNQLSPIENVSNSAPVVKSKFAEMLERFEGITLSKIYRQGAGSGIILNGDAICSGKTPKKYEDFEITITNDPIIGLRNAVIQYRSMGIDYSMLDNQIIVPTNKGKCGTAALNQMMQNIFRTEHDGWMEIPRKGDYGSFIRIHEGDKIILTQNDYKLGFFNGESGIVESLDHTNGTVTVNLGDRIVALPNSVEYDSGDGRMSSYDPRMSISLGYVITTHKSQGSEYNHVIYAMNVSSYILRNRRNLYTGITRAKEHCHLITDQRSLSASLFNKG